MKLSQLLLVDYVQSFPVLLSLILLGSGYIEMGLDRLEILLLPFLVLLFLPNLPFLFRLQNQQV